MGLSSQNRAWPGQEFPLAWMSEDYLILGQYKQCLH